MPIKTTAKSKTKLIIRKIQVGNLFKLPAMQKLTYIEKPKKLHITKQLKADLKLSKFFRYGL